MIFLSSWKSPKGVGPLTNGLNGLQMGVTNYLLTGMILQVAPCFFFWGGGGDRGELSKIVCH